MCQIPRTKASTVYALVPRKTVTILQSLPLRRRTSHVEVWIDMALEIQSEKEQGTGTSSICSFSAAWATTEEAKNKVTELFEPIYISNRAGPPLFVH